MSTDLSLYEGAWLGDSWSSDCWLNINIVAQVLQCNASKELLYRTAHVTYKKYTTTIIPREGQLTTNIHIADEWLRVLQ